MKDIIDYAENEMKGFETKKFNVVDSLILSQLAYFRFEDLVHSLNEDISTFRIKDLLKAEYFSTLLNGLFYPDSNKKLLVALAASPRFRDIEIKNHVSKLDYRLEKQFSAVSFHLNDETVYVAYRGTDMTFIGWKEDFNMAFKSPVPSQEEGAEYLNAVGESTTGGLRIGGHSKGGNIAVYSAMKCKPEIQERIMNVYSHDGPGFKDSVFQSQEFLNIKDKICKVLPQSSIIGMLLQSQESYRVIESTKWGGIMQHNPFSWIIENGDFCYVNNVSNNSLNMNKTINQWLSDISDQEREHFVDALYQAINSTNAKSINNFSEIKIKELAMILKAFRSIDSKTRKFLSETIRGLIVLYVKNLNPLSKQ